MVINDGKVGGVTVVETPGGWGMEEEVGGEKGRHFGVSGFRFLVFGDDRLNN